MSILSLPHIEHGYREDLSRAIARMPSSQFIGLSVRGFDVGVSIIDLPIRAQLTFDGQTVQGGIVGLLADYAAVSAAIAAKPEGWLGSTTNFSVDVIEPARGDLMVAIGRSRKAGARTGLGQAEVYTLTDGEAVLVALATAHCAYVAPRDAS